MLTVTGFTVGTLSFVFSKGENDDGEGSTGSSSPLQAAEEEDEEDVVPKATDMEEEDIPLAKTGFTLLPAYAPIQVSRNRRTKCI